MKQQHTDALTGLLAALKDTGCTFPVPECNELMNGWAFKLFFNDKGISVVSHDGSNGLETADITGSFDDWEFVDDVEGWQDPADVAQRLVKLCNPAQLVADTRERFLFDQNNSGGSFVKPVWTGPDDAGGIDGNDVYVFAKNKEEARHLVVAWSNVYFDGVSSGMDCNCCGDRWYGPW